MHLFIKAVAVLFTAAVLSTSISAFGQAPPASGAGPKPLLTATIDSTVRVAVPNSVHPLAKPEFQIALVAGDTALRRLVLVLSASPDSEQALTSFLQSVQDKSSPNFHQWLTPEQFAERFGPAPEGV